jgi:signal transduction histidine kinase
MSISAFIRNNMTEILAEWTAFAEKTAPPEGEMTKLALTDHAQQILTAIALDIDTHQSDQQQYDKSQGEDIDLGPEESAAAVHGRLRHASNFSLLQLSSEFRALRATVLRLWLPHVQQMSDHTVKDMVRFNEAIDQALAESIVTYSERADRTRDLFLAVLGHDLRAPLATISLVGELLSRQDASPQQIAALAERTKRSAMQMDAGMPTTPAPLQTAEVCKTAVADAQAMYPNAHIVFHAEGDLQGEFDDIRLLQLVTNLLINAAQHSDKGTPVTLSAHGDADAITLKVANIGPVIPAEALQTIFQPLVQLEPAGGTDARPKTSLGLGLFIAQEITAAHGGTISVTSSETDGTVFTVRFPRDR